MHIDVNDNTNVNCSSDGINLKTSEQVKDLGVETHGITPGRRFDFT